MAQDIRIDKRIIKTKSNLKSALVELLKTHKIEDISIVELTTLANVNRKTFYLHYDEVSSVFKEIENSTYEKVKNKISTSNINAETVEQFLNELFSIFVNDPYVLTIMRNTPYSKTFTNILEKALIEEVNRKYELINNTNVSTLLQYTIAYHVFGSVRLFYTWLKNSQNLDLATFCKFLATLIIKGSKSNFDNV